MSTEVKFKDYCLQAVPTSKSKSDQWIVNAIYRKISLPISYIIFKRTNLHPNILTLLAIPLLMLCLLPFFLPFTISSLITAITIQLWYVFDCVDGEIARAKKLTSLTGKYLDLIVDHLICGPIIFLILGLALYGRTENPIWILLGAVAGISICAYDFIHWYGHYFCVRESLVDKILNGEFEWEPKNSVTPPNPETKTVKNVGIKRTIQKIVDPILPYFHFPYIMNYFSLVFVLEFLLGLSIGRPYCLISTVLLLSLSILLPLACAYLLLQHTKYLIADKHFDALVAKVQTTYEEK